MSTWESGRGRRTDYKFGTRAQGWSGFEVVRFHGVEEISKPYELDITLARRRPAGLDQLDPQRAAAFEPVDLEALLDVPASLAIHTGWGSDAEGARRVRLIHGIIAEAEELDRDRDWYLYRVLLVAPIFRARYRRRCRNFVGHWLKKPAGKDRNGIIELVLENAPTGQYTMGVDGLTRLQGEPSPPPNDVDFNTFVEPRSYYRWAVLDASRLESQRLRAYVVQYNESDLDFLSRLLEEEGISYYFEHVADGVVMTLTDQPGRGALFPHDNELRYKSDHGGSSANQDVVRTFRKGLRLRSRRVTMRDYYWPQPDQMREGRYPEQPPRAGGSLDHFEFPARDETADRDPGVVPSRVRAERFEAERNLCYGSGSARTMEPGFAVRLFELGPDGAHAEDLVVVRVETFATELQIPSPALDRAPFGFHRAAAAAGGPSYENEFVCLPAAVPFRPAMSTPKPRIDGVQTARVTAEDLAGRQGAADHSEVHCDELGRVRVRFPWDQKPIDGTMTSKWIRVSQQWAGGGFGGQYTPRVGHEVLVAYLEGDPERPVIVGRVYNGANRAPFRVDEHKLRSTLRSDSSHNDSNRPADGSNEIRFEDRKGGEQIYVHAQMDLDEVVENDHTTAVERDQKNTVKRDQFNTVERNRQQKVLGWEEVTTEGDRRTEFRSNETHTVKKDRTTVVGENERLHVIGWRDAEVNGMDTRTVHQDDTVRIGGQRYVETGNNQYVLTRGLYDSRATANHEFRSSNIYFVTGPFDGDGASGDIQAKSATLRFWQNEETAFHARNKLLIHVGSSTVTVEPGLIRLGIDGGASISLTGGAIAINATAGLTINGRTVQMHATGGGMTLDASQDVNIEGKGGYTTVKGTPSVKLNP